MAQSILVNLPVAELARSIRFCDAAGARRNPQFSDSTAACMVISDTIHVMLLTHEKFRQFATRRIVDAHADAQVLLHLTRDGRDEVDVSIERAVEGGREPRSDAHVWEAM